MAIAPQPISLSKPSTLTAAQRPQTIAASTPQPLATAQIQPRTTFPHALLVPIHAWHLFSLDAPSVATLWAFCFARAFHLTLSPYALPLLFAGTWLLYITDRILDGLRTDPAHLRERHFFYMHHRGVIAAVAFPVCAFLGWLILFHMLPAARRADVLIFSIVAAYFGTVHISASDIQRWFPKELIVALVFAAATAVPTLIRLAPVSEKTPSQDKLILLLMSALFAALCWLNCVGIEKWEQFPRRASRHLGLLAQHPASADRTTQWGQRNFARLSSLLALAAVLAAAILVPSNPAAALLCVAVAAAALLLIALDRSRLSAFHLRIAADAALLTPILVLFLR